MGRMHSKGKGMSGSALPYKRTPPSWLKVTSAEVRASPFSAAALQPGGRSGTCCASCGVVDAAVHRCRKPVCGHVCTRTVCVLHATPRSVSCLHIIGGA